MAVRKILAALGCLLMLLNSAGAEELIYAGEAYQEISDFQLPEEYYQYSADARAEIHVAQPDELGRAVYAYAVVTPASVAGQVRDNIADIIPSGFEQAHYSFIEKGNLYDRCHLVAAQFANTTEIPDNIITGTHYMNLSGMKVIEDRVASYVQVTGKSLFYAARPDFRNDEVVCRGVWIMAATLEDPKDFSLCAYCFNVQPGVIIDYSNGFSDLAETTGTVTIQRQIKIVDEMEQDYILNIKSHKFHLPGCTGVTTMKEQNRKEYHGTRQSLIEMGFSPCGTCNP